MYGFTHPGSSCRLAAASARLQIARKKRNFIHSLTTDSGLASTQEKKAWSHIQSLPQPYRHYTPRSCALNFSNLGWLQRQLSHLDVHVQMDELRRVILEAPKEKAPGPDGFIRIFFQPAGK
jgi:hypothetical protein